MAQSACSVVRLLLHTLSVLGDINHKDGKRTLLFGEKFHEYIYHSCTDSCSWENSAQPVWGGSALGICRRNERSGRCPFPSDLMLHHTKSEAVQIVAPGDELSGEFNDQWTKTT